MVHCVECLIACLPGYMSPVALSVTQPACSARDCNQDRYVGCCNFRYWWMHQSTHLSVWNLR